MEYIKLKISVKDRFMFLFFGLISKKYLINTDNKCVKVTDSDNVEYEMCVVQSDEVEEKIVIPFFDFSSSTDELKSNLK